MPTVEFVLQDWLHIPC